MMKVLSILFGLWPAGPHIISDRLSQLEEQSPGNQAGPAHFLTVNPLKMGRANLSVWLLIRH